MSLERLPDEVFQLLLYYVPPVDNLRGVQLLSRRFYDLSNGSLLWKYHCRTSFRFWRPHHDFPNKLQQKPKEVDWKSLFLVRHGHNITISRLLDEVVASRSSRWRKFERICKFGYDAKDILIQQSHTDESAKDVLARRYFSSTALDSMHRAIAIHQWHGLRTIAEAAGSQNFDAYGLERCIGGFDMFVVHDQPGDIQDLSLILDATTAEFRSSHPNFFEKTTREKALALNHWLRIRNLVGMGDPDNDRPKLRHFLLGQALRHEDHESTAFISCVIYSCIAQRLDISAHCVAPLSTQPHIVVFAPLEQTLDGKPTCPPRGELERMCLDPFRSNEELEISDIRIALAGIGWPTDGARAVYPESLFSVGKALADNIKENAPRWHEMPPEPTHGDESHGDELRLLQGNDAMNVEAVLYAAQWAKVMLTTLNTQVWARDLAVLFRKFRHYLAEDAWILETYIRAGYERYAERHRGLTHRDDYVDWNVLRHISDEDYLPAWPKRRGDYIVEAPYKVGQVFRHRSRRWLGAIVGWTRRERPLPRGTADPEPPVGPPGYRDVIFFPCVHEQMLETSLLASESIEIITDASLVTEDMFPMAGKYFKRFDRATCTFVSNVRETYPDD